MGKEGKSIITTAFDFDMGGLAEFDLDLSDLGNFSLEDTEFDEITHYTKPKVYRLKSNYILYEHAEDLARDIDLPKNGRVDAMVNGSFIFGDFIEAFFVDKNIYTPRMVVSTLSMSQENIDSFKGLMEGGFIGHLDLIVSIYFYSHERTKLIPYFLEAFEGYSFTLSVAAIHTKTVHFITEGGRHIVIHGSANLRSSANIEQFTIEDNPFLLGFYEKVFNAIIEKYKLTSKVERGKKQWETLSEVYTPNQTRASEEYDAPLFEAPDIEQPEFTNHIPAEETADSINT